MNYFFIQLAARIVPHLTRRNGQTSSGAPAARSRRGIAVLLVLGMLAMTLALAYASLRGQATVAKLAENLGRGEAARMAAESGVFAALRKMSDGSWAGIGTPLTGNLSDSSWYEVTFATGDELIKPGKPLYDKDLYEREYAFRVTITSVGYANDPGQPDVRAIHKIDAIVQLARRSILAEPPNWSTLTNYTVHQWGDRDITVQEPVRINGNAHLLGHLRLSTEYPPPGAPQNAYLSGLNQMRLAGRGDHRPFQSPLAIALLRQDALTLDLLTTKLGLPPVETLAATTWPAEHPATVASYKLYPGGKSYLPPVIQTSYGSSLQNRELLPNPLTNPLGIYRSRNTLMIYNNVRIKGTIISEGTTPDIQVHGTSVSLEAANLAALEGNNQIYQLPVAIIKDDLRFHGTSNATVKGLAIVYDEFGLVQGAPTAQFSLTGSVFASGLALGGRDSWVMTSAAWTNDYNDFNGTGSLLAILLNNLLNTIRSALGLNAGDPVYFPEYMQHQRGFTIQPKLKFDPEPDTKIRPHWHNWSQPVYQKDPIDPGLRWNLVRWTEAS
jgi:hypothetical protein